MPNIRSHFKVVVRSLVGDNFDRPAAEAVETIAATDVTVISELVGAMYTMDGSIRPLALPAVPVCGVAITAKCPPGDNQALIRALADAQPGDVLVADARGFSHWCLGGFLLLERAKTEYGLAGLVANGAYRDVEEIRAARFPVYATGVSPYSGPKVGPGEVNVAVSCGGVVVHPGDVLSASAEGVVVVPGWSVEVVAQACRERLRDSKIDIGPFIKQQAAEFDQGR